MDKEDKLQTRRSITREISKLGNFFQVSACNLTVQKWEEKHIFNNSIEEIHPKCLAKHHLLYQLQTVHKLLLELAFQEYLGMLPQNLHPKDPVHSSSTKSFVDSIMSKNSGIPVMIMNVSQSDRFVILYENQKPDDMKHLKAIDDILSQFRTNEQTNKLDELAGHIEGLMKLICSSQELALIIFILSLLFPHTAIRHKFNISEDKLKIFKDICYSLLNTSESEEKNVLHSAKEQVEACVEMLESDLQTKKDILDNALQKEKDVILIENLKQDLKNVEERLKRTRLQKKKMIRKIASRKFKTWKENILRQKGKGKGKYRIDRGAEVAVYQMLQEQLVAHYRRKGMPTLERRIQRKELRYVANEFLKSQGKKLIKSYETVCSWALPRNKRSIQSNQHRGKGLYCHRKPQQKFVEEHINIHYNRAFIKNYTRFLFSKGNCEIYKEYSLRRCIDDKAYLRCGTSEGFTRPANTPIVLKDQKPSLPAYDFPEKVGYISPGVNLIIKDMEEIETKDQRSKFALRDSKILVTCKPKLYYPSSATNWANDLYCDRIESPNEHDIPRSNFAEGFSETVLFDDHRRRLL